MAEEADFGQARAFGRAAQLCFPDATQRPDSGGLLFGAVPAALYVSGAEQLDLDALRPAARERGAHPERLALAMRKYGRQA
jgi:hypothetical protein